jgi:hypothetical protein
MYCCNCDRAIEVFSLYSTRFFIGLEYAAINSEVTVERGIGPFPILQKYVQFNPAWRFAASA